MWGMRPGPVSDHVLASLLQTGHFSKGILKASCDVRRGQYHQLQQVLARRGQLWARQYQQHPGTVDENSQGHDALYLPWIQASLIASNPALHQAHFQEYQLTPDELDEIQSAPALGTDWLPVPDAETARLHIFIYKTIFLYIKPYFYI